MASTWHSISGTGIEETHPSYLNKKIKISNQLALCLALISIGYGIICLLYYPAALTAPVLGIAISITGILLNSAGAVYVSRFILSITPVMVAGAFNAYVTKSGEMPLSGLYMIELTFALTPFLVIDLREKNMLSASSLICFLTVVSFDATNAWLEIQMQKSVLHNSVVPHLTVILSVMLGFLYIFIVTMLNTNAEKETQSLLVEMNKRNESLLESEKELKANMEKIAKAQEEERQRDYISESLAGLTPMLRSTMDTKQMAEEVIGYIIKQLKANQGGFYLVKEEGTEHYIELIACYAYERKKFLNKRVEAGQGLLGQAYLEKDVIYLTEVPDNYVTITSGLGRANPTCIVIIPLINNDKVEGLFEIATFMPLAEYHLTFLKKAAENIAAIISSNLTNEKTRELLRESQILTEQIRAGEEEMRQNMEELQATQEEMFRKEKEYIEKIHRLEEELEQNKSSVA